MAYLWDSRPKAVIAIPRGSWHTRRRSGHPISFWITARRPRRKPSPPSAPSGLPASGGRAPVDGPAGLSIGQRALGPTGTRATYGGHIIYSVQLWLAI